ncbi:hypothetical protein FB639_005204, partial [Coemansia asiatica]
QDNASEHCRIMLMLYHPWRNEENDLAINDAAQMTNIFEQNHDQILHEQACYTLMSEEMLGEALANAEQIQEQLIEQQAEELEQAQIDAVEAAGTVAAG